jgi:hypothetical protein
VNYGIDASKLWTDEKRYNDDEGTTWRNASFGLQVRSGSASIYFSVKYRAEQVAFTEADYAD